MNAITSAISLAAATIWSIYSITHIFIFKLPNIIPSTILLIGSIAGIFQIIRSNKNSTTIKISKLLLILLILSISIATMLQISFSSQVIDEIGRSTSGFLLTTTITSIAWLLIGCGMQSFPKKISSKSAIAIIIFMASCIYINADDNYLINWAKMQSESDDGNELNHLIVGFQSAYLLLLAYSLSPKTIKIPISIISLMILFSLGGRTSLLCYLATLAIYNLHQESLKKSIITAVAIFLLLLIIFFNIEIDLNDQYISRMLFQGGIDQDESKIARDQFFLEGIEHLPYQSLYGDINLLAKNYKTFGSYSHNILSAWQIYGIIPFLLIVGVSFYIGKKLLVKNRKNLNGISEFGLLIYIFSITSILTGKFIGFPMYWMAIGFWLTKFTQTYASTDDDQNTVSYGDKHNVRREMM